MKKENQVKTKGYGDATSQPFPPDPNIWPTEVLMSNII